MNPKKPSNPESYPCLKLAGISLLTAAIFAFFISLPFSEAANTGEDILGKWQGEDNHVLEFIEDGTPFAPKFPKMVKIAFKPTAGADGAVFSAVIPHYHYSNDRYKKVEFEALFRDIRVTK